MNDDNEAGSGKAVVFYDKQAVSVPFRNFSAKGKTDSNTNPVMEQFIGVLVVFNALESIINASGKLLDNEKKMIEGLSSEISVAYVNGWKVLYYVSFKKYANFNADQLPREFTTSDDDGFFNKTTIKDMTKLVHSFLPRLQTIRFIGTVSKKELEEFGRTLQKDSIKFQTDSPYLVVVDV